MSRVGHHAAHLAAVELADDAVAASDDAETWNIRVVRVDVSPRILAAEVKEEWSIGEAALPLVHDEAFDGRTGSGCALTQVDGDPVPRAEERGAHGTRRLALRAVHRFAEVRIGAALAECGGRVAGPKGSSRKVGNSALRHLIQIANLNIDKWRFKNLTRYVQLLLELRACNHWPRGKSFIVKRIINFDLL